MYFVRNTLYVRHILGTVFKALFYASTSLGFITKLALRQIKKAGLLTSTIF